MCLKRKTLAVNAASIVTAVVCQLKGASFNCMFFGMIFAAWHCEDQLFDWLLFIDERF
jgi:hypothetical protein